jgi:oxygen-independent coproporphyrinogen-3 oxidase
LTGVYVHLPFCPYICPYCDFAKWRYETDDARTYLAALRAELGRAPDLIAQTLYLGGGTPNTYAGSEVAAIVRDVRDRFSIADDAEITSELNPDLALCTELDLYREAGVNRLSIGVQSFDVGELKRLGRGHTADDVAEVVRRARAAGFDSLSLDLIFAAPGQTTETWSASLDVAIALGVEHISTYGLTIEETTPYATWFARDPAAFPSNDLEADLYAVAIEKLTAAGFEHYEVSNFARPGRRSRHNANYWANGDYLGLGVGAASYLAGERRINVRDFAEYCAATASGRSAVGDSERLTGPALLGEATMLALRTAEGVDTAAFGERYGVPFLDIYEPVVRELGAAGLLETDGGRVRLSYRGRFLANDVCAAFLAFPAAS